MQVSTMASGGGGGGRSLHRFSLALRQGGGRKGGRGVVRPLEKRKRKRDLHDQHRKKKKKNEGKKTGSARRPIRQGKKKKRKKEGTPERSARSAQRRPGELHRLGQKFPGEGRPKGGEALFTNMKPPGGGGTPEPKEVSYPELKEGREEKGGGTIFHALRRGKKDLPRAGEESFVEKRKNFPFLLSGWAGEKKREEGRMRTAVESTRDLNGKGKRRARIICHRLTRSI